MLNKSGKAYIIKYANGEGNMMTFEHAQTEEGRKALEFAKEAGEEVTLLDTLEAVDMFLGMCNKEPTGFNA